MVIVLCTYISILVMNSDHRSDVGSFQTPLVLKVVSYVRLIDLHTRNNYWCCVVLDYVHVNQIIFTSDKMKYSIYMDQKS
jgi:hypothetical protein